MGGAVSTARLVAALEAAWAAIQAWHEDVPEVVMTIAGGSLKGGVKLGHFAPDRWQRGVDRLPELFVGGEGLASGGAAVMATLLHEAAHGAAHERGIQDTSRQGRWHNLKFKTIAESFGLAIEQDKRIGWSTTHTTPVMLARYAVEIAAIDDAITAYRRGEWATHPTPGGDGEAGGEGDDGAEPKKSNNGAALTCGCGRKIRASRKVVAAGPITCGLCGTPFEEAAG